MPKKIIVLFLLTCDTEFEARKRRFVITKPARKMSGQIISGVMP
jgi:hypothetical protein